MKRVEGVAFAIAGILFAVFLVNIVLGAARIGVILRFDTARIAS